MQLTLAPDRTALAGTVWTSVYGSVPDEGRDIVLVREPADQPVPSATICSGGEPSGACFLGPLHTDRVGDSQVVDLGDGNLLLVWLNRRGASDRVAGARFDAVTGAWQKAEFLDDGAASVGALALSANHEGGAMMVYEADGSLYARAYDRDTDAWSGPQPLVNQGAPSSRLIAEALFVHEGSDATLLATALAPNGTSRVFAYEYDSATSTWQRPHLIDGSPELATFDLAAAADAAGNAIAVTVHGGPVDEPYELWFSRRSQTGTWSAPALFYSVGAQILRPAVAVGKDGTAIVTWQEFLARIASNVYSFEAGAWSQPLTVASQPNTDNRTVVFDAAGAAVAYFHCNDCFDGDMEQKSTLSNGAWSAPQVASAEASSGATFSTTLAGEDLEVARIQPRDGENAIPPLERASWRCAGY